MIRDINNIDDDIIRKKRIIGRMLYTDSDIFEVLDTPGVDPTCPDELLYNSIYPFIRIPEAQDTAKSYITYMLDDIEQSQFNKAMKIQYLNIVIFVHTSLLKTKYGGERHDVLAYLVRDIFQSSNVLGTQTNLVSNREGSADNNFCTRSLRFEIVSPNHIRPFKTNQYEVKSIVNQHDKVVDHEIVGGDDD